MFARTAGALLSRTYNRYLLASVVSLGCDMAVFLALYAAGIPSVPALALGYMLGIVIHWIISTRFVFDDASAGTGAERTKAKGLFVLTALMGLAITMLTGMVADHFGLDAFIAKLAAIVISFQATYLARRAVIFRA